MFKIILAFTLGGLTLGLQACRLGCTDMGCSDQLSGVITTPTGAWPAGSYVITITTERASHTCTLNLPEDYPDEGTDTYLACEPALANWRAPVFQQEVQCTEVSPTTLSCVPIPDQYAVHWGIEGTPEAVTIQVERDGVVLADEDFSPEYEKFRPNGDGCSPVCRQAEVTVELP